MSDAMMFPETIEEFIDQYKLIDTDQIYTNGSELIQVFRVMQWVEHERALDAEPVRHGYWIPINPDVYGADLFSCSVCGIYSGDGHYRKEFDYEYCPNCGAKMDE